LEKSLNSANATIEAIANHSPQLRSLIRDTDKVAPIEKSNVTDTPLNNADGKTFKLSTSKGTLSKALVDHFEKGNGGSFSHGESAAVTQLESAGTLTELAAKTFNEMEYTIVD